MSEKEYPHEHIRSHLDAMDSLLDMIVKIRNGKSGHIPDFQIDALERWIAIERNKQFLQGLPIGQ